LPFYFENLMVWKNLVRIAVAGTVATLTALRRAISAELSG
jgi:hypothetical protein